MMVVVAAMGGDGVEAGVVAGVEAEVGAGAGVVEEVVAVADSKRQQLLLPQQPTVVEPWPTGC